LAALNSQKLFTFMKGETIFEDPKGTNPGPVLMQLKKSMGSDVA